MAKKDPEDVALAADGADVLPGTSPPSAEEVAAVAELTEDQQRELIAQHLNNTDEWKASPEAAEWEEAQRGNT